MKPVNIKVATYYYWLARAGSYCGLRIYQTLLGDSKFRSLFDESKIPEKTLNLSYEEPSSYSNVDFSRYIEKILRAKKHYREKESLEKEALRILDTSLLIFVKSILVNSIPPLVAGLVFLLIIYLPSHILKHESPIEFITPESTQSFVVTEEFLETLITVKGIRPSAPTGLRIITR
jgi:hypothetical protein